MKDKLKKLYFVKMLIKMRDKYKRKREFISDYHFFEHNYMRSKPITKEKVEYEMILEIHKLEKGFACKEIRPFGIEKVKKLISLINKFDDLKFEESFSYDMSLSALEEYKKFYEEKKWTNLEEYLIVDKFLKSNHRHNYVKVGAYNVSRKELLQGQEVDFLKLLSSRKSVRNYAAKKLKKEDINKAIKMALLTPSACNRQMCKIYYIENKKEIVKKYAQGLGLFDMSNINYFIITFDVSNYHFIGERNQGWFNAGLLAMNFVNSLHNVGIGSCFCQFGNSNKEELEMKKELKISNSERIAVIIAAGYYDEISRIPYSTRKSEKDIYYGR